MSGITWCYPHSNQLNRSTTSMSSNNSEAVILIAKFDYQKKDQQELDLKKNERLLLLDNSKKWWLVQKLDRQETGYVPSNYVKKEKRSLLDKLMPKKSKRVNSATSNEIAKDLSDLNIDSNNTTIQSDQSNENLNITNSSDYKPRQKAVVKYKYSAKKNDEISLAAGVIVTVLEKYEDGWWRVEVNGGCGLYPSNYLEDINQLHKNSSEKSNLNELSSPTTNNMNNIKPPQNTLFAAKTIEHLPANNTSLNSNIDESSKGGESLSSNENDIEYVRVIYPYTAKFDNELTVIADDILKLIDDEMTNSHDLSNSWIKVMNSRGIIGVIPSNCVQPIIDNTILIRKPIENNLFSNNLWYYGNMGRQEANNLLNKYAKIGDFLVRDCERDAGNFSISLKSDNSMNKHFKVLYKDNFFMIGKKTFNTMDDLIEHYKKHPIFDQNSEKLFLIKSFELPYIT